MSIFETLSAVNVNEHIEKKGKFSYLTWSWAWAEVVKRFEDCTYSVMHNQNGWNYFTDGRTGWVETTVTIDNKTIPMQMPIMDIRNISMPIDKVTSFDVNRAIQRCLTKNLAMFGLGLYIYSGEDLPDVPEEPKTIGFDKTSPKSDIEKTKKTLDKLKNESAIKCSDCGKEIVDIELNGKRWTKNKIAEHTTNAYGRCLCSDCAVKERDRRAKK